MNNKKKNQSTSTDLKTKVQTCKRCHMHGDRGVLLADHKLFCKYQHCMCPKCYAFLKQKRYSADVMILRRAYKLNEKKNIQEAVSPLPLLLANKKCGLHILLNHTFIEMLNSFTIWYNPSKIWHIFAILIKYSSAIDERIKFDPYLESTKAYISQASLIRHSKICQDIAQNILFYSEESEKRPKASKKVIRGYPMPFMTMVQQEACCYFPPSMNATSPDKEQLVEITSLPDKEQLVGITSPPDKEQLVEITSPPDKEQLVGITSLPDKEQFVGITSPPDKEQLIGIRSPQYPLQNLPIYPYNSLPIYTDTPPFLGNSLKPPTEPPSEPFIDPCTEFPESSTEPPTESYTYY